MATYYGSNRHIVGRVFICHDYKNCLHDPLLKKWSKTLSPLSVYTRSGAKHYSLLKNGEKFFYKRSNVTVSNFSKLL
jgi:hypothetical protein